MENGGIKPDYVECRKPVYKEGAFVEIGGRVWHSKFFECEGCRRNTAKLWAGRAVPTASILGCGDRSGLARKR